MGSKYIFCPNCHNLLIINQSEQNQVHRFECYVCPFYINITRKILHKTLIEKGSKDTQGIIDAEKEEQRRQKTQVICPICSNDEAFFHQMQTRSADEPMTNFYECSNKDCRHNWRD